MQETQLKLFLDNTTKGQRFGLAMDLETGNAVIAVGDLEGFHDDGVFNFTHEEAVEIAAHLLAFAETHREVFCDGTVH